MKICFVHVPKTGGTSLKKYLDQFYVKSDICPYDQVPQLHGAPAEELRKYNLIRGHIQGHAAYAKLEDEFKYITVVRNPVDRVISNYYFDKSEPDDKGPELRQKLIRSIKAMTLEEFVSSDDAQVMQHVVNGMLNWYFGKQAVDKFQGKELALYCYQKMQRQYTCVGLLEDLDNFQDQMHRHFGFSSNKRIGKLNVGRKNKDVDYDRNRIESILHSRMPGEIMFYDVIREHLARFGAWSVE